ncbi:2-amino-4-hydroxy-6-hydroxymethyldihydropteridine diphosphokinase [Schaalia vaccimaxillae]|uniref:2-amino-4-hydroxy-6- hydroxymethyldihydropteridine diphosphokinase n=1 Tax=Schaalia vaccimaxillae TaxID=183916 RepID=UPI0003B2E986|nr:2-amino-4-hydroxy-6-hydroxymethyldihydropteridine diphosphokinase [Schaalia vaccimaxillae]
MGKRLDVITLRGLTADGVHGVLREEQTSKQPFCVDVSMWLDASLAAATDDINDTVSYAQVADEVVEILTGRSVRLIETLAHTIADRLMEHRHTVGVEVTVHKPKAPISQVFADVSVTVRRGVIGDQPRVEDEALCLSHKSAATEDIFDVPARIGESESASTEGDNPHAPQSLVPDTESKPVEDPQPEERCAVLALGGNVGDVPSTLMQAVSLLIETSGIRVDEVSPLLRTRPVLAAGQDAQDDYWNSVVLIRTTLSPEELLGLTSQIEHSLGRVRDERWGPRTIDIDIIQIEGVVSDEPSLTLPHPRVRQRAFVLAPWMMADPDAVLEGKGKVGDLLQLTPDRDGIIDAVADWLEDPETVVAESDEYLASQQHEADADACVEDSSTEELAADEADVAEADTAAQTLSSQPVSGPSRLDLVPEASKTGLAPVDDGSDIVWRKLWSKWAATPAVSDSQTEPVGDTEKPELEPSDGVDKTHAVTDNDAQSFSTDNDVEMSIPQDLAPNSPGNQDSHGDLDSLETEASPEGENSDEAQAAPRPRWLPLNIDTTQSQAALATAGETTPAPVHRADIPERLLTAPQWESITGSGTHGTKHNPAASTPNRSEGRSQRSPRLPQWNFSRSSVRIVDEVAPSSSATSLIPAAPSDVSVEHGKNDTHESLTPRRSILDPQLPEGTPIGPLNDDEITSTGILRKAVIRPTTTGQLPITKNSDSTP